MPINAPQFFNTDYQDINAWQVHFGLNIHQILLAGDQRRAYEKAASS